MILREDILQIEEDKNPWMCVKCTQLELGTLNSGGVRSRELAHLEGKLPFFRYEGDILQLDPATRQYKSIGKYRLGE